MATIYQRLSTKKQPDTGLCEVLLTLRNAKDYCLRAKSGIYVTPDNFKDGEIKVNRRKVGNDVPYHDRQAKRMNDLCIYILKKVDETDKTDIDTDWFKTIVREWQHPEAVNGGQNNAKDLSALMDEFLSKKNYSEIRTRQFRVLLRTLLRYEGFVRATDRKLKNYVFNVGKVKSDDIEDFFDYMRNEYELSQEYPKLFEGLKKSTGTIQPIRQRSTNTLSSMQNRLRTFFHWLIEEGKTKNRPFDGIKLTGEQYGTPFYITIAERNRIADADLKAAYETMDAATRHGMLPLATLEQQRDIFTFQCLTGCRVGDMMRLTPANIVDGFLVYTPHKTKDNERAMQARVPLIPRAQALIGKYHGVDRQGRLFPFISPQKYNDAIKAIFTLAGVTRFVERRNPTTGENEMCHINEIASSHLARRTFVGNAYFKVSDPNIIGKMSGHVEGSKAFARYRKIEDETLQDVMKLME